MPRLVVNPITSASQYGLAQAVAGGTSRAKSAMTPAVAREMIARTPSKTRERFARELAARRENLATTSCPGSRGFDVVIGARRKHFDSHAAAHRYGMDQQNKGVHAGFVIVDSATGKREEFGRSGAKNPASPVTYKIAHAAGTDAGNRSMKKAGRTSWNAADYNAAARTFAKLIGKAKTNPFTGKHRKRNPEAAAAEMYEKFHGKPSKRIDTVTEDIHVHEHLAALGDLIEMKVKTIKGETFCIQFDREDNPKRKGIARHTKDWLDRRFKAIGGLGKSVARTWINPRKANPKGPVTLASNEKGTALFIVGGDQKLDLAALGLKEFTDKESVIVGEICTIDYFTTKNFGEGDESFIYTHKMNEDTGGPRPMLRYDTVNHRCHIDGGLYHIEKPMLGTSPGLEN